MKDESRATKLYSIIMQQIKNKDHHKLCFVTKNNKIEPIILRVNMSLNTTAQAYKNPLTAYDCNRALNYHPKAYKIIEPIIIRKPRLSDNEIELEEELVIFKREVEKKYTESVTNTTYKYPINHRTIDDCLNCQDPSATIPSTIYYLKEEQQTSTNTKSNSLEPNIKLTTMSKKQTHKKQVQNELSESFYSQIHKVIAKKRKEQSNLSTLTNSQNISDLTQINPISSYKITKTHSKLNQSRNISGNYELAASYKQYTTQQSTRFHKPNLSSSFKASNMSKLKTLTINNSNLPSNKAYSNNSKSMVSKEPKFNNTIMLTGIGSYSKYMTNAGKGGTRCFIGKCKPTMSQLMCKINIITV